MISTGMLIFISAFVFGYENFDSAVKEAKRLADSNKKQEAVAAFQEALNFSKETWQKFQVQTAMANLYLKEKKYQDAENMVQELYKIELNKEQMSVVVLLSASIYAEQGKNDKAAAELKRVLEIEDDASAFMAYYCFTAAELYCNKIKDYERAAILIKKIEANDKTPQWIKNRIGIIKETIAKNKK